MKAIGHKTPEYKAGDGSWIGIALLQKLLKLSRTRVDAVRKELGNPFEHTDGEGHGAPVYIYAPLWLPAYYRWRDRDKSPTTTASVDEELRLRTQRIKLENAELDLDERRIRHAERKKELIRLEDAKQVQLTFLQAFARIAERLPDEYKRLFNEEIDFAVDLHRSHNNGHSDTRILELSRRPPAGVQCNSGKDEGPSQSPGVRAKVRGNASRRSKGRPEVS